MKTQATRANHRAVPDIHPAHAVHRLAHSQRVIMPTQRKNIAMTAPTVKTVPIAIFGCNASDDAWACNIPASIEDRHEASISKETYDAIAKAKAALDANPAWDCVAVTSDMDCNPLDEAMETADFWRTGNETFLVYRFGGLYLRLLHKDNRQAEIEFEVTFQDGRSIPPTTAQ